MLSVRKNIYFVTFVTKKLEKCQKKNKIQKSPFRKAGTGLFLYGKY